jgi:hypothetical protein
LFCIKKCLAILNIEYFSYRTKEYKERVTIRNAGRAGKRTIRKRKEIWNMIIKKQAGIDYS